MVDNLCSILGRGQSTLSLMMFPDWSPFCGVRVGEASHPGPGSENDSSSDDEEMACFPDLATSDEGEVDQTPKSEIRCHYGTNDAGAKESGIYYTDNAPQWHTILQYIKQGWPAMAGTANMFRHAILLNQSEAGMEMILTAHEDGVTPMDEPRAGAGGV